MAAVKRENLPEIFVPDDPRWASRAAARGEIRRLARGLYSTNLDEPAEQLLRRRWYDVAALYFPGAVIVDRSAVLSGPAPDGSLFVDSGPAPARARPLKLPGLTLRPRSGPGPIDGDIEFANVHIAGPARTALDNMRHSRERSGVRRTLRREEMEERLDRLARVRGDDALNELRDEAHTIAPALEARRQAAELDRLVGALMGTREENLRTPASRPSAIPRSERRRQTTQTSSRTTYKTFTGGSCSGDRSCNPATTSNRATGRAPRYSCTRISYAGRCVKASHLGKRSRRGCRGPSTRCF